MSAGKTDVKFSQSEAVTRCRNVKESKLKGNYALVKLADEEGKLYILRYFFPCVF